jgi:hypothetical protein
MAGFGEPALLTSSRFARHIQAYSISQNRLPVLIFANFAREIPVPFTVPLADSTAAASLTVPVTGIPGAGAAAGIVSAIRDASTRSGMNFDLMLASARLESGLDPSAQAGTSSATGLFQFIDQTWLDAVRQYGPQHGLAADAALVVRHDGRLTVDDPNARQRILDLRKNPDIASAIAGDHLRGISDKIGLVLGRPPDAPEIYLGHLLGSGGASQLLQAVRTAPTQAAADLLPAAARANAPLFAAPDGTPYTVTQFMQHLRARVARAYAAQGSGHAGRTGQSGADQAAGRQREAGQACVRPSAYEATAGT